MLFSKIMLLLVFLVACRDAISVQFAKERFHFSIEAEESLTLPLALLLSQPSTEGLIWSQSPLPFVAIDVNSQSIEISPTTDHEGLHSFQFYVLKNDLADVTQIAIEVPKSKKNHRPKWRSNFYGVHRTKENELFSFSIDKTSASDSDGDLIQIVVFQKPLWLNAFEKGNKMHFVGIAKKGTFPTIQDVVIEASDGKLDAYTGFQITVE